MRALIIVCCACALIAALAACGGKRASVVSSETDLHLSGNWNDADSRAVADELIPQCLSGGWIDAFATRVGRTPIVRISHVAVRVQDLDEVVESGIITDDLLRALQEGGAARVVAAREEAVGVRDTRVEMAEHAAQAPAQGQELAPDYLLTGVLLSQNDQVRDEGVAVDTFRRVKFYQLTLSLVDVTTNEIAWSGSAERKKVIEQSSLEF